MNIAELVSPKHDKQHNDRQDLNRAAQNTSLEIANVQQDCML